MSAKKNIVQNIKKSAKADFEYFREIHPYEEAIDWAIDRALEEVILERKEAVADLPLSHVIRFNELDANHIMKLVNEVEED